MLKILTKKHLALLLEAFKWAFKPINSFPPHILPHALTNSLFSAYPPLPPTTACSRFRCLTMEVTRPTQMTSVAAAAARQHRDLKLFPVRFPWRLDLLFLLLLFSRHGRQLAKLLLLSSLGPPSLPLLWAHLQRVADPRSRQHMLWCRTRAQREPSFRPWRLSRSA